MTATTLSDERVIANKLGDFARILDTKQWHRVGEVFGDDIAFNYGDNREQQGIAALRTQFASFLDRCGATQHLLGSIQIEIDGDNAISRSYVQARHCGAGDKANAFVDTNGEYIDRWQRRDSEWRIVRRDARWDIFMGDASILLG